jgi:hypothetical protein
VVSQALLVVEDLGDFRVQAARQASRPPTSPR